MKPPKNNKVLLGMSGGIDSSTAAILLKNAGYEVFGITIRTWDSVSDSCISKEKGCCTIDAIMEAKNLAKKLEISHTIVDARDLFRNIVVENFISEYLNGKTPNPCVLCNPEIKWKIMLHEAEKAGCDFVATGHYAKIQTDNNRYFISKGKDLSKDQSYFLWKLSQNDLSKTLFPLGDTIKTDSRLLLEKAGFEKIAKKKESQEICFIPDDDYRKFLIEEARDKINHIKQGNIIDSDGKIIGKHKGYPFYTIGQRKGLEVALGYPVFVSEIIPETNTIVLTKKENLFKNGMILTQCMFQKYPEIKNQMIANVKIRFRNEGHLAELSMEKDNIKVLFKDQVAAITPGQSAVIYENNDIIAGGIIDKIF